MCLFSPNKHFSVSSPWGTLCSCFRPTSLLACPRDSDAAPAQSWFLSKPCPRRPHPELWTALSGVPGRPYSYPIQARAPHHIYIRLPPAALPNWWGLSPSKAPSPLQSLSCLPGPEDTLLTLPPPRQARRPHLCRASAASQAQKTPLLTLPPPSSA